MTDLPELGLKSVEDFDPTWVCFEAGQGVLANGMTVPIAGYYDEYGEELEEGDPREIYTVRFGPLQLDDMTSPGPIFCLTKLEHLIQQELQ